MNNKFIPILVVLLIGASFFAGSLWTKVNYLEDDNQQVKPTLAPAQPEKEAPVVLGEADQVEIEANSVAVKGKKDAPITIVEFSEYQCPYCARYVEETYTQLMAEYGDQIYYIFHDYPLPFHQHAQQTAVAARCAGEQGKYWEYHDLLFEKNEDWSAKTKIEADLKSYAQSLGLNTNQFSTCLNSDKYDQAIKDDLALGAKVGVSGTPTFFINGTMLVGAQPFASFKRIIEESLR